MSATTTADNSAVNQEAKPVAQKKPGFFRKKSKAGNASEEKEEKRDADPSAPPAEPEPTPVPLSQLFRFSTKKELLLDGIGLVAAAASGAAQPLMSLLFGDLTEQFVDFFSTLASIAETSPEDTESSQAAFDAAAADFRRVAASNASYLVYLGIGMLACTYTYMVVWVYTGEVNAKRVRERYLKAILRQDVAFFDKVGAGEVATRIQTDTHLVQVGTSEKVALVVMNFGSFVTGFVLAYVTNWRLALAMSSILPCLSIAGTFMDHFISKYMQASLKHVADGGTVAEEVISTIRTAHAFGSQSILSGLYNGHILKSRAVDKKIAFWLGGGLCVFFFVIYGSYGLAFSFGSKLIDDGHATVGDIMTVFFSIIIGSFSLTMMPPHLQAIQRARGAAAKLYKTIDRVPDIDSADPSGEKPESVVGEITFEGVKFNYPSRPTVPVVKGISLTFRAGKTAALVGASGSGKSTIVSLVERFYDPLAGTVKLDGKDLKTLNLKWLRSQIGLVAQEPTLFATTIKQNVAHGLIGTKYEHASDEEKFALIKEACVKANADGFISKLPLGYETMVGERGFLLSGGQKQRVAIARAIVSDPRILLLDEATSALDTQSEGIVQDALDKAAAGRTTITIAHRLSTIKDADVIFVMGDGLVLEQGTHNELLNNPDGPYARLVQAQKLREAQEQAAVPDADSDSTTTDKEDMEKAAREEIPLGRKNTGRSLASEIIEQKRKEKENLEEQKSVPLTQSLPRLLLLNPEVWRPYAIGTVFAIMSGAVYPAIGIVFAEAIQGFGSQDMRELRRSGDRNALWFFITGIAAAIAILFQNYYFTSSSAVVTAKLRILSFKAMLRQDVEFFDKDENSTGSLTSSLSENPQKLNGLAGTTLGAIVQAFATFITGVIIGLVYSWKLALVGFACAPVLLSAGYVELRVVTLKDEYNQKAHKASAQLACEAAAAIRTVAALTREDDCSYLYSKSLEEPLRRSNRTALWSSALYAFSQASFLFVVALVFWYGSRLVSFLEIGVNDFFVALMSTTFGTIQAGSVFAYVPDISSAKGAASEIIKLLDSVPSIDAESTEGNLVNEEKAQGHVRFENIHFRYPTRPGVRVLRDLNLEVIPGTYIALVGASGSGKSTVIQLIERFYDPLAGNIFMDGETISDFNVQDYRKQISLVSQEPTLYAGTIRFNILLGAIKPTSEITDEELEAACRDANILDFIQSLPDGFDTDVGGKGSQLSGGQKQRIAIARALLRNPKVLLLDEATSALDSNSEKVVQQALDQAAKGRTTIAIAHRLSTIQNADRIYFIKDGRVSETGTHDQLLGLRGDYYELVQQQALSRR